METVTPSSTTKKPEYTLYNIGAQNALHVDVTCLITDFNSSLPEKTDAMHVLVWVLAKLLGAAVLAPTFFWEAQRQIVFVWVLA